MRDYKINNTNMSGCGCPSGNPPCSWCTETFTCDCCGNREYTQGSEEKKLGWVCENCLIENRTCIIKLTDHTANVYQGGNLIGFLHQTATKLKNGTKNITRVK